MGLQLSVLVGCVGALEILACLKHVFVCVFKFTDASSHCCIDYFHPAAISDNLLMITEKPNLEDEEQVCSEIEAIFKKNTVEPDHTMMCMGPPVTDCYVRVPTPIPFGVDDENIGHKSSSIPSSLLDSGNENPTMIQQSSENFPMIVKHCHGSSSDVSSVDDDTVKSSHRKVLRRSRTPEIHAGSCDDYDDGEEEDVEYRRKHHKPAKLISNQANKRYLKSKSRNTELGRSSENLSTGRRSKRHREPERCKSDIQIPINKNSLRDEWTNTSPLGSDCNLSRTSSKKSISVLVQTSFEDKMHFPERSSSQNSNYNSSVSPNCRCCDDCKDWKARQTIESYSVNEKPQLVKISSFEEATNDDYEKLKRVMVGCGGVGAPDKNQVSKDCKEQQRIKSSIDSESYDDEFEDAVEVGLRFSENPIQYSIPDLGDNQAFWVIRRPSAKIHTSFIPRLTVCD